MIHFLAVFNRQNMIHFLMVCSRQIIIKYNQIILHFVIVFNCYYYFFLQQYQQLEYFCHKLFLTYVILTIF